MDHIEGSRWMDQNLSNGSEFMSYNKWKQFKYMNPESYGVLVSRPDRFLSLLF